MGIRFSIGPLYHLSYKVPLKKIARTKLRPAVKQVWHNNYPGPARLKTAGAEPRAEH